MDCRQKGLVRHTMNYRALFLEYSPRKLKNGQGNAQSQCERRRTSGLLKNWMISSSSTSHGRLPRKTEREGLYSAPVSPAPGCFGSRLFAARSTIKWCRSNSYGYYVCVYICLYVTRAGENMMQQNVDDVIMVWTEKGGFGSVNRFKRAQESTRRGPQILYSAYDICMLMR